MSDKIIKIKNNQSELAERAYRKRILKADRTKEFQEPTIELLNEQSHKFDEFLKYCETLEKCVNGCKGYISIKNYCSNDNNEITALCGGCLQYTIDSSQKGKDYVIWFNNILKDYDMNFKNGFPKLMKHRFMGRCNQCDKPHDKEQIGYWDFRL